MKEWVKEYVVPHLQKKGRDIIIEDPEIAFTEGVLLKVKEKGIKIVVMMVKRAQHDYAYYLTSDRHYDGIFTRRGKVYGTLFIKEVVTAVQKGLEEDKKTRLEVLTGIVETTVMGDYVQDIPAFIEGSTWGNAWKEHKKSHYKWTWLGVLAPGLYLPFGTIIWMAEGYNIWQIMLYFLNLVGFLVNLGFLLKLPYNAFLDSIGLQKKYKNKL